MFIVLKLEEFLKNNLINLLNSISNISKNSLNFYRYKICFPNDFHLQSTESIPCHSFVLNIWFPS